MNQLEKNVYSILKKPAIDILDEEDEVVASATRWKLAVSREDGSTNIGLLNLWVAMKLISRTTDGNLDSDETLDKLLEICDNLIEFKLLSEDPLRRREKFTLITNEELNAKREERGPYSRPVDDRQTGGNEPN